MFSQIAPLLHWESVRTARTLLPRQARNADQTANDCDERSARSAQRERCGSPRVFAMDLISPAVVPALACVIMASLSVSIPMLTSRSYAFVQISDSRDRTEIRTPRTLCRPLRAESMWIERVATVNGGDCWAEDAQQRAGGRERTARGRRVYLAAHYQRDGGTGTLLIVLGSAARESRQPDRCKRRRSGADSEQYETLRVPSPCEAGHSVDTAKDDARATVGADAVSRGHLAPCSRSMAAARRWYQNTTGGDVIRGPHASIASSTIAKDVSSGALTAALGTHWRGRTHGPCGTIRQPCAGHACDGIEVR